MGELLPFSAFMMYCDVKDLHDPRLRATLYVSDKPHATGTLKNYCFPPSRPQVVQADELGALDFKHLIMRHGGGQPVEVLTNTTMTAGLTDALARYRKLTSEAITEPPAQGETHRARMLIIALDGVRAAF